jgi:hypothetical protein
MQIIKGVFVILLAGWVILATIATVPLDIEYKWQSWTIVAMGPVVIIAGLWEVFTRLFGKRVAK